MTCVCCAARCVYVMWLNGASRCVCVVQFDDAMTCVCCAAQCVYAMWFNGASRCVFVVLTDDAMTCVLCGSMCVCYVVKWYLEVCVCCAVR